MAYVYPLVTALVCLVFGVRVWGDWRARRRPYQFLWSLSLFLGTVGSLAYVLTMALGGNAFFFKLYYVAGALLVAPVLGLGSSYLALPPGYARVLTILVAVLGVVGAAGIFASPVDRVALSILRGGPGQGILQGKSWLGPLVVLQIFGTVAVVLPALASAWRLVTRQGNRSLAWGNILIAAGVIVIAAAGTAARFGSGWFWPVMTLGWIVTFWGFLTISRQVKLGGMR